MTIFQILGWVFLTIICFIFAPFMTIGVILIGCNMPIMGIICFIIGIFHMLMKVTSY